MMWICWGGGGSCMWCDDVDLLGGGELHVVS